jgi:hypothetical protein
MEKKGEANFAFGAVLVIVVGLAFWLFFLGGWETVERYFFTETIYVQGSGEELVIDRDDTSVVLDVDGASNEISFSPETRVLEITIKGEGHKLFYCESQDPVVIDQGRNNEILEQDC